MSFLSITYTPGVTSPTDVTISHRICYRYGNSGDYCCLLDETDSVAGTPKVFIITIAEAPCDSVPDVDPESCVSTRYEGYVQADCEEEDSLAGRTGWEADFQPDPTCVNKLVCCVSERELEEGFISIVQAGSGYDDSLSPLTVSVVRDPADPVSAGGAKDGVVEATITGDEITALTVITPGLYGKIPTLVIPTPTNAGSTAQAILVIPCSDEENTVGCDESINQNTPSQLLLGECVNQCFPKSEPWIYTTDVFDVPDTVNYSYSQEGCCDCTTCKTYTVVTGSDLAEITVVYTECSLDPAASPGEWASRQTVTVPGSGFFSIDCAVPGSIFCIDDPTAIISITETGDCAECGEIPG